VASSAGGLADAASPPVRAQAVANIASALRDAARAAHVHAVAADAARATHAADTSGLAPAAAPGQAATALLRGSSLIQELPDSKTAGAAFAATATDAVASTSALGVNAAVLSDSTLGLVVGTLLGMLGDGEPYVYLGAVHALQVRAEVEPRKTISYCFVTV
jgi:hypothetical protein